jgi:hypothetical protein
MKSIFPLIVCCIIIVCAYFLYRTFKNAVNNSGIGNAAIIIEDTATQARTAIDGNDTAPITDAQKFQNALDALPN